MTEDDQDLHEFQDDYLGIVAEKVAEFGHTYQHVMDSVPMTYTVGLTGQGFPELVLFGLPPQTAQAVLGTVVEKVKAGEQFTNGQEMHDVVAGFPVMVIEVADAEELLVAQAFVGPDRAVTAWQVVFPDAQGLWPWDEGSRVSGQTVLGEPPR